MRTLAILLILALMAASASAQLIPRGSALNATLLYYQPVPAQPGDTIDVWIQVANNGGSASAPGTLTILDSGPFTPQSASDRESSFPQIPSRESFLVKAQVQVDKNANEGMASLKVRISEQGTGSTQEASLPLTIIGRESALSIVETRADPAEVLPGSAVTISILVENVGETAVRNVEASLGLGNVSLAPQGSSASKTIRELRGGERHTFTFTLASSPDAAVDTYRLPLSLTYNDERGNEKSQSEAIGITIGAEPELLVYVDSVEAAGEDTNVVIRLVNTGLAEIKLVQLRILPAQGVSVKSPSQVTYVGNIDEDDYETAEVTLGIGEDRANVSVQVVYRDALNRQYEEQHLLMIDPPEVERSVSAGVWVALAIVAVGLGVWLFRRRRRRR